MITAEFFGGPADGQIRALPGLVDRFRFPIPAAAAVAYWHTGAPQRLPVADHELIRDEQFGLPSLADDGRYRYRYVGVSEW